METEKKNSSGAIVGIIIGLIIALVVVGCLYSAGIISFNTSQTNNNEQTSDNNSENQDNSNKEVDESTRNKLFDIVGIPSENNPNGLTELNDFVSNNDYGKNAAQIIKYSSVIQQADVKVDDEECAPGCYKFTKENAEKLIKIYNFSGTINDYFIKSKNLDNIYIIHTGGTHAMIEWNGPKAGIKHESITSEYFDTDSVRITDKKVVSKYTMGSDEPETNNQTVTYEFKKDTDGNYFLNKVTVITNK